VVACPHCQQPAAPVSPGGFDLEAPATALFSNFELLSKQVTLLHYEDDLGIPLVMAKLKPVEAPKPAGQLVG